MQADPASTLLRKHQKDTHWHGSTGICKLTYSFKVLHIAEVIDQQIKSNKKKETQSGFEPLTNRTEVQSFNRVIKVSKRSSCPFIWKKFHKLSIHTSTYTNWTIPKKKHHCHMHPTHKSTMSYTSTHMGIHTHLLPNVQSQNVEKVTHTSFCTSSPSNIYKDMRQRENSSWIGYYLSEILQPHNIRLCTTRHNSTSLPGHVNVFVILWSELGLGCVTSTGNSR